MLPRHSFSVTVLARVPRCVSVPSFVLQVNVVDVALGTHRPADKHTPTQLVQLQLWNCCQSRYSSVLHLLYHQLICSSLDLFEKGVFSEGAKQCKLANFAKK